MIKDFLDSIDPSIIISPSNFEAYTNDHSPINGAIPDAVLCPRSHHDCLLILELANLHSVPIIIRGAGTGTTGGAVSNKGAVIMSVEKMNSIIDFDINNAMITVQPGVIVKDLMTIVESKGLFYPPDPASIEICTIGGNIAQNAGGPRAVKYGVTADYVIGLKGIWANGSPFNLGGKQIKNVVGYNLIKLIVGSEGTLGVVTEITLKLIPKPRVIKEAFCGFDQADMAAKALIKVRQSGIQPSVAEYMLDICVDASLQYLNVEQQFISSRAYLIWQVDGVSEASVSDQLNMIKSICSEFKSNQWTNLETKEVSDYYWNIRRYISLGLKKLANKKCSEDVVVPPASVPEFLVELESMQHSCGISVLGYGHLGDGNIHVNILKMSASQEDWDKYKGDMILKVMQTAVKYGGTISGEHGIGLTKKPYLKLVLSENDIKFMKQIKKSIDPNNILNPGKIFDE